MSTNIGGDGQRDERMWGMLCHLSAFAGFIVVGVGIVLGPLVVWLIKRDQYSFVNDQGKEALNFQITIFICSAVLSVMTKIFFILIVTIPLSIITGLALVVVMVFDVIQVIMASTEANKGNAYRYPFALRLIQ
jgi:hypothetical protein